MEPSVKERVVHGYTVCTKDNPEVPCFLWIVHPPANPAIRLHRFRRGMLNRQEDPLVSNPSAIRSLAGVTEVFRELHDV